MLVAMLMVARPVKSGREQQFKAQHGANTWLMCNASVSRGSSSVRDLTLAMHHRAITTKPDHIGHRHATHLILGGVVGDHSVVSHKNSSWLWAGTEVHLLAKSARQPGLASNTAQNGRYHV